jgi:outer membrane protein TolC
MSVAILHPEQQYLFTNEQMSLIYDLLSSYLNEAEEAEEVALTQETIDVITIQSVGG